MTEWCLALAYVVGALIWLYLLCPRGMFEDTKKTEKENKEKSV